MPRLGDVGDISMCVCGSYGGVCVACGDQCGNMGLMWSVSYEEYGVEKWFFVMVIIGEVGCHCVLHYQGRYCDNLDYSYSMEGLVVLRD